MNLKEIVKEYDPVLSRKAFLVDTTARILFYVPIIALWEKFGAGMENEEVMTSRTSAILINIVAGRVHGKAREFLGYLTKTDENSSELRKTAVDSLTGLVMGTMTYTPILYTSGADMSEASVALPFALTLGAVSGRPYGKFLDWYRNKFGVISVYENE
jgi:hypothetical protein